MRESAEEEEERTNSNSRRICWRMRRRRRRRRRVIPTFLRPERRSTGETAAAQLLGIAWALARVRLYWQIISRLRRAKVDGVASLSAECEDGEPRFSRERMPLHFLAAQSTRVSYQKLFALLFSPLRIFPVWQFPVSRSLHLKFGRLLSTRYALFFRFFLFFYFILFELAEIRIFLTKKPVSGMFFSSPGTFFLVRSGDSLQFGLATADLEKYLFFPPFVRELRV